MPRAFDNVPGVHNAQNVADERMISHEENKTLVVSARRVTPEHFVAH